jgi:hypothetical protein
MTLDELISQVKAHNPDGTALDHLSQAVAVSERLGELADHLVGHFVDQARRSGASWTTIGQNMGVTKQAAQKRFVAGESSLERFTGRAKIVVMKAQNEARMRGHAEVDTLHLLLGIAAEWQGIAGQALHAKGITPDGLTGAATATMPTGGKPTLEHIPFSSDLKKVNELVIRESLRLGHNYVGTEHILLALLEARETAGARILADLGISKEDVEAYTLQALEGLRSQ